MNVEDELVRLRQEIAHLRALLERPGSGRKGSFYDDGDQHGHGTCPASSERQARVERSISAHLGWEGNGHELTKEHIGRYSRQIILPSFGAQAQSQLCQSSILVIGAGGLGCPVVMYLAATGVGRLGIVDHDTVELNNLHRQIAHRESTVGVHKADSAGLTCRSINSSIQVEMFRDGITPQNAVELVRSFDVVVDATDNATSRYLISDACVVAGRPLVSGAAIGTDGQLTVYNHGPDGEQSFPVRAVLKSGPAASTNGQLTVYTHKPDGPCYRCLFPEAPEPQSCSRCSDAGVLGVVPGIIGSLQALEAIKIASGVGQPLSRSLLLFDALAGRFTRVQLRPKMPGCIACGERPQIVAETLPSYPYAAFTGALSHDAAPAALSLLDPSLRLTAPMLQELLTSDSSLPIVDVRPEAEFKTAHMPGAINLPFNESKPEAFTEHVEYIRQCFAQSASKQPDTVPQDAAGQQGTTTPRFCVVCRRGNDSQRVVALLKDNGVNGAFDLVGGLNAWAAEGSVEFPAY